MARTLSRTLLKFQEEEKKNFLSIADGLDPDSQQLVKDMYDKIKITSEDLSRQYTAEEVRELCVRTKCRVMMHKLNCVWDAKQKLEKAGRFENRSESFIDAMLVKAVKRKMVFPYSPEEVDEFTHISDCQLKKENNYRLDRWARRRLREELRDESDSEPDLMERIQFDDEDGSNGEQLPNTEETPIEASEWAEAVNEINSESMSVDSQLLQTQSQSQSQPLVANSEDYAVFNTQIPLTSTQSSAIITISDSGPFL